MYGGIPVWNARVQVPFPALLVVSFTYRYLLVYEFPNKEIASTKKWIATCLIGSYQPSNVFCFVKNDDDDHNLWYFKSNQKSLKIPLIK
jgi:hypothetical protein